MPNITVTVADDVLRRAKVHAAERGVSVSALVAEFLSTVTETDDEFRRLEALQDRLVGELASAGPFRAGDRIGRDELHERTSDNRAVR